MDGGQAELASLVLSERHQPALSKVAGTRRASLRWFSLISAHTTSCSSSVSPHPSITSREIEEGRRTSSTSSGPRLSLYSPRRVSNWTRGEAYGHTNPRRASQPIGLGRVGCQSSWELTMGNGALLDAPPRTSCPASTPGFWIHAQADPSSYLCRSEAHS